MQLKNLIVTVSCLAGFTLSAAELRAEGQGQAPPEGARQPLEIVKEGGRCGEGKCWGEAGQFYRAGGAQCYLYPAMTVSAEGSETKVWRRALPRCPSKGGLPPDLSLASGWQGVKGDRLFILTMTGSDQHTLSVHQVSTGAALLSEDIGYSEVRFNGSRTITTERQLGQLEFGCSPLSERYGACVAKLWAEIIQKHPPLKGKSPPTCQVGEQDPEGPPPGMFSWGFAVKVKFEFISTGVRTRYTNQLSCASSL